MNVKAAWPTLKQVFKEYSADNVTRLSGSLAYYTIISLAPLLVLTIMILGVVYGDHAQGKLQEQIGQFVGPQPAAAISEIIKAAGEQGASGWAITMSIVVSLIGASAVFMELQGSMNTIFDVEQKPGAGWGEMIHDRLLSLGMVLGIAFLLLVSLVVSAALSVVAGQLSGGWTALGFVIDIVVSLSVISLLFAAIFKFLPDVELQWKDTLIGAVTTGVLFVLGKYLLSWYLSQGSTASAYGAAGSLVALLIWVYYSSQIMFIGAEFTQVYANRFGSRVKVEGEKARPKLGQDPSAASEPSRSGTARRGGQRDQESVFAQRGLRPAAAKAPTSELGVGPMGARATHHRLSAVHAYQPEPPPPPSPDRIGALTTGAVLGGVAALAGVLLKRKAVKTEYVADKVDARLERVEERVGSLKHLRALSAEERIARRLHDIEHRILDDARAARKVETMSLKDRLVAMLQPRT